MKKGCCALFGYSWFSLKVRKGCNMRSLVFLVVAAVVGAMGSVGSAALFFDDFESYDAGAVHGVGGWEGWDKTPSAGAPVSEAHAFSGTKSIDIVSAADLVHPFDVTAGKWVFSVMQYIPSGTTGTTWFILLNQYPTAKDWSVQTKFESHQWLIWQYLPCNFFKNIPETIIDRVVPRS